MSDALTLGQQVEPVVLVFTSQYVFPAEHHHRDCPAYNHDVPLLLLDQLFFFGQLPKMSQLEAMALADWGPSRGFDRAIRAASEFATVSSATASALLGGAVKYDKGIQPD